jgi:hypothetical protein
MDEAWIDSRFNLEEIVRLIYAASHQLPPDSNLHPYIETIIAKCPIDLLEA